MEPVNDFVEPHLPRRRCKRCQGTGQVPGIRKILGGTGGGSAYGPCPDCDGIGWVSELPLDLKTK